MSRIHLARTLRGADDQARARILLEENDRWYHDLETQTLALDALARAAAARSDLQQAARPLQEADALHAQIRHVLDDADRIDAMTARRSLHAGRLSNG